MGIDRKTFDTSEVAATGHRVTVRLKDVVVGGTVDELTTAHESVAKFYAGMKGFNPVNIVNQGRRKGAEMAPDPTQKSIADQILAATTMGELAAIQTQLETVVRARAGTRRKLGRLLDRRIAELLTP